MPMPDSASVWGPRLREARLDRRLTQAELGARVGVAQTSIARWEGGEDNIADDRKVQLAVALDLDLDELFPWSALITERAS